MNDNFRDDAFINSIIGEGTRFKGEFDLNGLLRIDGDFIGSIRTKGKVLVGRNGRAECTMHAGTVVIGGVMRGEIFSTEKVIILSTGLMLGNITSPRLIVEEGVIIHGTYSISPEAGAALAGQQPAALTEKPAQAAAAPQHAPAAAQTAAQPHAQPAAPAAAQPHAQQPYAPASSTPTAPPAQAPHNVPRETKAEPEGGAQAQPAGGAAQSAGAQAQRAAQLPQGQGAQSPPKGMGSPQAR